MRNKTKHEISCKNISSLNTFNMTLHNILSIMVIGSEKSEKNQAKILICEDEPTET